MPITPNNPFKGRQHPGELSILCVRLYLRYPLSYEHVTELMAERGVEVDASCIWRWVQAYAPELNKRCRPHLKLANKSYRIDETYDSGQRSTTDLGCARQSLETDRNREQ
jgi:transposase, IS6 family